MSTKHSKYSQDNKDDQVVSRENARYVDLKINGRLFPSWVMKNFKAYKLPEVVTQGDTDPCSIRIKEGLRKYQEFVGKFLDYRSPYRDILLYHGLGSGKSNTAINIYNILYNYTPGWNVFILIKASLEDSWLKELKRWMSSSEYEFRFKNIVFIHYDSPTAHNQFMDAVKNADSSKKSLYIIDEVHNFIRNVYSNISTKQGRRAQVIYDYIIQDKKENEGVRVVVISGTPAVNNPFELALLFNLLRPGIFPKSEAQFNQTYIGSATYRTISTARKNMFQRRIIGLVSYYIGATPDYYATTSLNYVNTEMSRYQTDIYNFYEEKEKLAAAKKKSRGKGGQETYRTYTRQACNFVFPEISQHVMGELRPRPHQFRLSEREAEKITEGKTKLKLEKNTEKYLNVQKYQRELEIYIEEFDKYINNKNEDDIKNNHTLNDDIKTYHEKYKDNYEDFYSNEKIKSGLYNVLHTCSAKMVHLIFNIMKSPGPVLVYSNYVLMEGLQIFKIYLKCFGFASYKDSSSKNYYRYAEYHGAIDKAEREDARVTFNKSENKYGENIKILMISPAGSEGISVNNIRQIHIMEPYWNEVRITQMIGRGRRQCSHKDLPMKERHIDIFRYKSVRGDESNWTSDQYIEDHARGKDSLIQSFLDALKEVAVDCALNKNHNMTGQEYKCFQFDEPSLFEDRIGPAYKEDIFDDMNIDNGLNSTKSTIVKIKAYKIKAVIQLSPEDDKGNATYSEKKDYLFNQDTGVVYDPDLYFPIGKVSFDEDNVPKKLDENTYIIDKIIPIPTVKIS